MLKSRFITGFIAAIFVFSLLAQADTGALADQVLTSEATVAMGLPSGEQAADAIVIDGDKLELHMDRKMRALGNASISRGKQSILGDDIEYDELNDALHVMGNVRVELGNAKLTGPELHMQLSEEIGEMRDASITIISPAASNIPENIPQNSAVNANAFSRTLGDLPSQQVDGEGALSAAVLSATNQMSALDAAPDKASTRLPPQSRGDAKMIFFEGQDKKRLIDARYTTCAAGVDDWYIKAKELKINDYTESGVAKNAYIEIKGVPILYTPWLSFSYGNQRKSGLLAPTYGTTTLSGFEAAIPFYWNISPNMDATLVTRLLSKRGVQLQGEFRYLEDTFSGIDNLEFLPADNQSGTNRYYANLKHQQTLGNGWSAGYSFEKVSDNQYFSDLSTRIVTTSRVILPQQFNVDYADDVWRFNAIAQKFQTLDNVSYPYERLPQMSLTGNKYLGDINANLYTQLVAFDTNSTNLNAAALPTATRITAYPSISMPISRSYGYITPKIGMHHTSYSMNNDPNNIGSIERTLPIASLDSGLFFDRNFKISNRSYVQTLEPRLFYTYIPNHDQRNIPIFDTGVSDFNFSSLFSENQFTGNDRINNANQLSTALTTRFIDADSGAQRLSASIGQRYYFVDQKVALDYNNAATYRKSNSSDIIAGFSTHLKTSWKLDAFWQYNTADSRSVRRTFTSRYNPEPGKTLNVSYSNRSDLTAAALGTDIDQFDISAQWPLSPGWYGIGRTNYSLRDKHIIETLAGVEYNAGCWQTRTVIQRVSTATAQANYALFFQVELGGIASIGSNPLTIIKRNIPGYVKTGLIPEPY